MFLLALLSYLHMWPAFDFKCRWVESTKKRGAQVVDPNSQFLSMSQLCFLVHVHVEFSSRTDCFSSMLFSFYCPHTEMLGTLPICSILCLWNGAVMGSIPITFPTKENWIFLLQQVFIEFRMKLSKWNTFSPVHCNLKNIKGQGFCQLCSWLLKNCILDLTLWVDDWFCSSCMERLIA